MIHALSIAGDVFWILALAIMTSMSWASRRRIPDGVSVPVAWRGDEVRLRVPKWAALWLVPVVAFAVGAWLKIESRGEDLSLNGALIWLGVRVTLAPLFAIEAADRVCEALD